MGICMLCIVGLTLTETVKLSGTVKNHNGKPLKGAVVHLVVKNLTTTTNEQGNFTISDVAVFQSKNRPQIGSISVTNGNIKLRLSEPSQVKIEFFDITGKLIRKQSSQLGIDHLFNIKSSPTASNMSLFRIAVGDNTTTYRYLQTSNGNGKISTALVSSSNSSGRMAKLMAAVDTLNVTASNFITKVLPLSKLDDNLDITLDTVNLPKFSFFLTSYEALVKLSKSEKGFGGDLRFGKTGQGAGILGADSICECIAEMSMPGSKIKKWRAFLSATKGVDGKEVNAIERIGQGPWYDKIGRLVANNIDELLNDRPEKAHSAIKNDLPNENGVPNHQPDPTKPPVDNHLTVTGSGSDGKLYTGGGGFGGGFGGGGTSTDWTCNDWTSTTANSTPRAGISWPRSGMMGMGMQNWISVWDLPGCEAGIDLDESTGAGLPGVKTIGSGGGYGGFYCFALNP